MKIDLINYIVDINDAPWSGKKLKRGILNPAMIKMPPNQCYRSQAWKHDLHMLACIHS